MSAKLLSGKTLSDKMILALQSRVAAILEKRGTPPRLAIISISESPAAQIFLKNKLQVCKEVGVETTVEALHKDITESEVLRILHNWTEDLSVDGIILEMPLPNHLNARKLVDAIAPEHDVEGMTTTNLGRFYSMKSYEKMKSSDVLIPCTPHAIIQLLLETGVNPRGLEAVVVGRSNIVGKPSAHLLSCLDATVTLCHSKTRYLKTHVRRADIVVTAMGAPSLIHGEWLKPKAIVLDAGISSQDGKVLGDVDFKSAMRVAGMLTPVPGGIGPLTITCLVANTVLSAERRTEQRLGP